MLPLYQILICVVSCPRTLLQQLQKLQALVAGKVSRPYKMASTQTGTCLMVWVSFPSFHFAMLPRQLHQSLFLPSFILSNSVASILAFSSCVNSTRTGPCHIHISSVSSLCNNMRIIPVFSLFYYFVPNILCLLFISYWTFSKKSVFNKLLS